MPGKAFVTINGRNEEVFGLKSSRPMRSSRWLIFNVVGTNITQKKVKGRNYDRIGNGLLWHAHLSGNASGIL